jgi:hypothetical protein
MAKAVRATGGEQLGDRLADTLRASGDEGGLVGQVNLHGVVPFVSGGLVPSSMIRNALRRNPVLGAASRGTHGPRGAGDGVA